MARGVQQSPTSIEPAVNADFLALEYEQVCESIRDCWKYLSELLRNFIFVQIILVSTVGLGSQVLNRELEKYALKGSENISSIQAPRNLEISELEKPAKGDEKSEESEKSVANDQAGDTNQTSPTNRGWRVWLCVFGMLFSAGACIQNLRLYDNAKAFIRRGAYLEMVGGFTTQSSSGGSIPLNTYINQRLEGPKGTKPWETIGWLTLFYGVSGLGWLLALFFYFMAGTTVSSGPFGM